MAPAVLDESGFDRFVSDNDTAVIGFIEEDGDAATFSALASDVLGKHPGVAFAQVHGNSRGLFDLFGLSGTATAIFRGRVGMYLEAGLPAADRLARESLAVHRVCPATRRGKLE
jgi:hypothetical protein